MVEGKSLAEDDIAILDAADHHYYQVRISRDIPASKC